MNQITLLHKRAAAAVEMIRRVLEGAAELPAGDPRIHHVAMLADSLKMLLEVLTAADRLYRRHDVSRN